jgi:hypothetical protein
MNNKQIYKIYDNIESYEHKLLICILITIINIISIIIIAINSNILLIMPFIILQIIISYLYKKFKLIINKLIQQKYNLVNKKLD